VGRGQSRRQVNTQAVELRRSTVQSAAREVLWQELLPRRDR